MRLVPKDFRQARKQYEYDLSAKIEEEFEMAPNVYKIGVEKVFGTLQFEDYVCRIISAIDPKTGLNLGDDFRRIISKDLNDPMAMGWRYKFGNNIWRGTRQAPEYQQFQLWQGRRFLWMDARHGTLRGGGPPHRARR